MGVAEELESPQCVSCIWKNPEDILCSAFPFGIPQDILENRVLHNEVLEEQNGDYIYTAVENFSK